MTLRVMPACASTAINSAFSLLPVPAVRPNESGTQSRGGLVNFDRINKEVIAVIAVGFRARLNAALMERKRCCRICGKRTVQADADPVLHEFSLTARDDASFRDVRVRAHADVAQLVTS